MTCTGVHPDCYTGGPRCPCAHPPASWGSVAWPLIKAPAPPADPPVEPDAHDRRDHDPGDEDRS